jgi:hypothetical protein
VKITYSPPASAEDATGLPVDRLGLHLLRGFAESNGLHSRNAMFQGAKHAYVHNKVEPKLRAAALRGLVEAFDWLHHLGLLARDPEQSGDFYFITRLGQQALDAPDGLALVRAQRRLDVDLHPRIGRRIRSQFLLGEYELTAFAALREVEIRVRDLAGASMKAPAAMFGRVVDTWREHTLGLPRRAVRHDPLRRPDGTAAPVLHAFSPTLIHRRTTGQAR